MAEKVFASPQSENARSESLRDKNRAYYQANRDEILARKRAKYAEDPEHVLGNQRARRRQRNINIFLAREMVEGAEVLAELKALLEHKVS